MQSIVISQMEPILDNSALALFEESDYEFARTALPGNLKLIEGLIKSDPENEKLLLLAAQGYSGYALGYLEDNNPERAKILYLRARDYAMSALRSDASFIEAEEGGVENLKTLLSTYDESKVPALFWAGFSWAGYINLSLTEPSAIMELAKVQVLMERVEELQPEFFYGGVYLFFGSVYGMKPRMLGGDPDKAKEYFDKSTKLTDGKFLLAQVYAAKYYAAKVLDEEIFDSYIKQVEDIPVDILPGAQLMNAIAKEKARFLKSRKEELF
jgi:tetratricopeptide (TPR) repeat protein